MSDKFVNLHLHSTYSLQDGIGFPEQYVERAKEIGQPAIAVTDHGNISSHYKWYKACKKAGITPILGCEMYIVKDKKDIREREYNHITILTRTNEGYRNLMKLVTKAWCEQFYYKPRITWQDLFDHQKGLIVLSGCLGSPIFEPLKDKSLSENTAKRESYKIAKIFKEKIEHFYIEFQPIRFEEGVLAYNRLLDMYFTTLKEKGFKGVVSSDCHYVLPKQNKLQEILLCIQSKDIMSNPAGNEKGMRWKFSQDDFYLKSREEMEKDLKEIYPNYDFSEELDETVKISEMIDFEFPKAEPIKFPINEDIKIETFKKMCYDGMKNRGFFNEDTKDLEKEKEYKDRLEYEIDLIIKKNFVDYFLAVEDMVVWAKNQGILVGPARGSAAGSLVCWALRITEVDPIKYGLIFQRFIDINRMDLPDIDLDFEDARRDEVKDYLTKKYGADKVGNIVIFTEFQGRSSLDDIGRIFEIPFTVIDKIKNALIERSGGDSRASMTIEDTFNSDVFTYPKQALKQYPELEYAIQLEGQLRNMGQHASGFMISNEPMNDFCAYYVMRGQKVISLAYKDASDIGLIKFDLLGINTLTVITKCLELIKQRHGKTFDMYSLPLDDPKVFKAFCKGKLFGVFQFDGQAVNQVCRQIQPKDFESLSAISALARPGPLNSGNTTEYIQRRTGKSKIKYVHPIMKDITKDSYGIVIYQEQVMRIMREIGKMSWEDTAEIRKLISRSQGVEKFNTFKDKFIPGALENGLTQEEADKIWEEMCSYGSWSFNKSHSVSYTIISYWTQWLKVYYPIEFYSSMLSLTPNEKKKRNTMREFVNEKFKVYPIDINKSKESFIAEEDGIRIGFLDIKGIGEIAAETIISMQPYTSYTDFLRKIEGKRITENNRNNLVSLGAFDSLGNKEVIVSLFGDVKKEYEKIELPFEERFRICPWDMNFGIDKNWKSFLEKHPEKFKQMPINISELVDKNTSEDVVIYGVIYDKNLRDVREVSTSKGKSLDPNAKNIVKLLSARAKKMFSDGAYTSIKALKAVQYRKDKKLTEGFDYEIIEQCQFANFIIEDDTDFITARISQLKFPEYGNLIFEKTKPNDVLILKGRMGSGIKMFFVNKIINLREYKKSLKENEQ